MSARLARRVLLLLAPPTLLAGGVLGLLYFLGIHHHRTALAVTLLVAGAAMGICLAFVVHGVGESLAMTLREMQCDAEIMAAVDPTHRLHVETGDELESLAAAINRLGDRLSAAQDNLGAAAAHATSKSANGRSPLRDPQTVRSEGTSPRLSPHASGIRRPPPVDDAALFGRHVGPGDRVDGGRSLLELDGVAFDAETTGLDPDGRDRIVSLAAVRVRGGIVRREDIFDTLVNPGRPIPAASSALHGVTDAVVADAPPIDVVLPHFLRFACGRVLIGHQVWFDLRFLDRESLRLGLPPVAEAHAVLDTLQLARLVNGSLGELGLDGLSRRLGVRMEGRHSARGDALATAEIYVRLLALLRDCGMVTLDQTLDALARLPVSDAF